MTDTLSTNTINSNEFFTVIEDILPPIFTREYITEKLGGIIKSKTLANVDCLGNGPSRKFRIGNKVAYEKKSFLEWLRNRISD